MPLLRVHNSKWNLSSDWSSRKQCQCHLSRNLFLHSLYNAVCWPRKSPLAIDFRPQLLCPWPGWVWKDTYSQNNWRETEKGKETCCFHLHNWNCVLQLRGKLFWRFAGKCHPIYDISDISLLIHQSRAHRWHIQYEHLLQLFYNITNQKKQKQKKNKQKNKKQQH